VIFLELTYVKSPLDSVQNLAPPPLLHQRPGSALALKVNLFVNRNLLMKAQPKPAPVNSSWFTQNCVDLPNMSV